MQKIFMQLIIQSQFYFLKKKYTLIFKILKESKSNIQIYGDFKCILIPSTDNINFGSNTREYQDHIVCSCGYKIICVDDRYSKSYKFYFGEDVIKKNLNHMIKESEYCSKIIETEFNKPIVMTRKDHEDF